MNTLSHASELATDTLYVDVRSPGEHATGHLEGSLNLPLADLEALARSALPRRDQAVILYCASGMRSERACALLRQLGYTRVHNGGAVSGLALTCGLPIRRL